MLAGFAGFVSLSGLHYARPLVGVGAPLVLKQVRIHEDCELSSCDELPPRLSSFSFSAVLPPCRRPCHRPCHRPFHPSQSRHPILERLFECNAPVPNDVFISSACNLQIVTGPNMAGKSTYLRQAALICLLAHTGCQVRRLMTKLDAAKVCSAWFCNRGYADPSQSHVCVALTLTRVSNRPHTYVSAGPGRASLGASARAHLHSNQHGRLLREQRIHLCRGDA